MRFAASSVRGELGEELALHTLCQWLRFDGSASDSLRIDHQKPFDWRKKCKADIGALWE
jgi:hypothetical protein